MDNYDNIGWRLANFLCDGLVGDSSDNEGSIRSALLSSAQQVAPTMKKMVVSCERDIVGPNPNNETETH